MYVREAVELEVELKVTDALRVEVIENDEEVVKLGEAVRETVGVNDEVRVSDDVFDSVTVFVSEIVTVGDDDMGATAPGSPASSMTARTTR